MSWARETCWASGHALPQCQNAPLLVGFGRLQNFRFLHEGGQKFLQGISTETRIHPHRRQSLVYDSGDTMLISLPILILRLIAVCNHTG